MFLIIRIQNKFSRIVLKIQNLNNTEKNKLDKTLQGLISLLLIREHFLYAEVSAPNKHKQDIDQNLRCWTHINYRYLENGGIWVETFWVKCVALSIKNKS